MFNTAYNGNVEILQIADSVAREKGINKKLIIEAMEEAVRIAGKRKYGEHNIEAQIDSKTGEIKLFRILKVVDVVNEDFTEISLKEASKKNPDIKIDDLITESLPPIELGRVAAQAAKQVILQKVREAERDLQYEEFKDKEGTIINAIVKRIEFGNIIADLGRGIEGFLRKDALIPNESFRLNDRIRAYISIVRKDNKNHQIFLSRTDNEFLSKLFVQEVPEIYDNIIEIKSVAREPGSRAKISVYTSDSTIDPVGSCVGIRGSRVQAVITELQGEKIDIIHWSSDPAIYIVNALSPAEISKVVIDEERRRIEVIVANDQLSLAIGRRGQNVRLASQLTGWNIDVLTEDEESKRRSEEFNSVCQLFMNVLDVEEVLAQLLVTEGFTKIDELAYTPVEELMEIEGFDEELSLELQRRANDYLESKKQNTSDKFNNNASEELELFLNMSNDEIRQLSENNIKTLNDFADLATDEFFEIVTKTDATVQQVNELIMKARNKINNC